MHKGIIAAKVITVVAVLLGLVAFVARGVFPGASVADLAVWTTVAAAAIGVAGVVALVCSLQVRQWILRHGGTDPQWLWFRADPPGLEELRRKKDAR